MSPVQKIREFIASANYRELVSLGYEIETQFDGGENEFDTDSFYDNVSIDDETILSYLSLPYNARWIDSINEHNSDGLLGAFSLDESDIIEYMLENEMNDSNSSYWNTNEKEHFEITGFDTDTDGSVSGWEFKTLDQLEDGGVDYPTALQLAETFYDELPSEYSCDYRCSCHTHIKVLGIDRHVGSYRLYVLILDELSKVWSGNTVPSKVLERIKYCHHHYAPRSTHTEKFNTVRVHPSGTWEFRLWGNCQDSSEVSFCVNATIDCFRKAYKRYFERDNSLWNEIVALTSEDNKPEYTFARLAEKAMRQAMTINEVISHEVITSR
jgi:hypothetical protein